MSSLKRYDNYKDSGVEWLGEIPEHWETLSNKNIFKIKQKLVGKKSREYDLLSLTIKGIIKRDMENPQGKFPAEFNTYQEVKKGDFIFCLFDVEETPRTVGLSSFDGMITGAYTVMTTENIDKGYLYYFYLNLDSSKRFKPLYRGLRNTIPKDSFFSFKTFIPPNEEQIKIAFFLDEKTAQIDEVISQKEKLIELLKERKQIVINDAVTKGLDKDVEFVDSGVEWIGKIPKHWKLLANKYVFNLKKNLVGKKSNEYDLLSLTLEGIIKRDLDKGGKFPAEFDTYQEVKKGDFVFCLFDVEETPRTVGLSKYDGMITGAYTVFSVKNINKEYLYYFYLNLDSKKRLKPLYTGLRNTISKDNFFSFKSFIPPKNEQIKIVEYIENQTSKIDIAIELQQNYISKLKEYKASLIDSVVTGKVKV
ncbi:restriction endonuclease subunit S [Aliarcobacter skirrowii]|uniref:restriction endonuclease subunit S n=1 Tax=Aliarcobacter skirrowii TaxID=28200 RepID=UPI0029BA02B7|nr:restriction endonuclease subunit S [Aliarcobacter skirrowii]MDX4050013.1 restriction endonuclease subunit S [Aliarcobacter skirrowii]